MTLDEYAKPEDVVQPAPEDVISGLRRSYDELTHSQKRIAEVIVEDPEFVAFATVDKLAGRLEVSPSTIVRFAYRLGLNGYPELQERVRELVRGQLRGDAERSGEGRSAVDHLGDSVFASSLRHDLDNLQRTGHGLRMPELEAAAEHLARARRVYVIGGATSNSVAHFASLALGRIRPDVHLLPGGERIISPLLDLGPEDVLLAFTFPPYAARTLRVVDWAKLQGATAVAISDSPISPVGQRVDVLLPAIASGIGTQNSLVAGMAIANALLNGVSGRLPGAAERYERSVRLVREWGLFLLEGDDGP